MNSLQSEKLKLEKQYKSLKSELQSLDPVSIHGQLKTEV